MSSGYAFAIPIENNQVKQLASGWLIFGVSALVAAGLFAILLVLARTPFFKDIFPWNNFFKTAMVVHVDLSVLMWFLPCAGIIWSINSSVRHIKWGWSALIIAALGALVVVISPFVGAGPPLMNNYFPVIESPVFFTGLSLFGIGIALLVLRSIFVNSYRNSVHHHSIGLHVGISTAAIAAAIAISAIIWSYFAIPETVHGSLYYEVLFWGGGHVLQFTHTLLMLVVWLWLSNVSGLHISITPRVTAIIFGLGAVMVLMTPWIYLRYDIMSMESAEWFTRLMIAGGGLAALPLGLAIVVELLHRKSFSNEYRVFHVILFHSILLFAVGGILGFLIRESNTLITAHYHGSNGAVTVAFMGLCYLMLPLLGFGKPTARLATFQAHAYGIGQLLHVLGLALAGGYGMQRKIAGSTQSLDNMQQTIGMAVMGIGGLIAVVGGVLFLIIMVRALLTRTHTPIPIDG